MIDPSMENLTEEAAGLAMDLLAALRDSARKKAMQRRENDEPVEILASSEMLDKGEYPTTRMPTRYEWKLKRLEERRKADFKRLLTACTKLVVNEA